MKSRTLKHVLKKLLVILLTILFVTLLSFLLMRLSPIDPATAYVKRNSAIVTEEQIQKAKILLGMDKPLIVQYFTWIKNAFTFNFGISLSSGLPVVKELGKSIPVTLGVVFFAAVIMIIGVLIFGCTHYLVRNKRLSKILTALGMIGISVPAFYLAILCIDFFAAKSNLMLIAGNRGIIKYLPAALCLSVSGIAFYSQMLFGSLEREMNEDYAFYARCRGLSEKRILFFHALPHAVTDLLPSFAQMIGLCLAGAAIVERVFSLPGLGYLIIDGVVQRDAPIIHASVLFLAVMLTLLDAISDILQMLLQKDKHLKGELF